MKKAWAAKNGFTIIELLVSIVVIGILVTIMIVSYNSIQQRSRDSERSSDIVQLKVAIEKYRAEKSEYPSVCSADNVGCPVSNLATELAPYISNIPHDPKYVADSSDDYQYVRRLTASDGFGLKVKYEAKDECKTGTNVNSTWWGSTIPTC
jgi:prepilin-type N-terminal cleavage/methylation domain-containing protein